VRAPGRARGRRLPAAALWFRDHSARFVDPPNPSDDSFGELRFAHPRSCKNFLGTIGGPFLLAELPPGIGAGTSVPAPCGHDTIACWTDRGREVWLRLTLKPFG
jgi:hypothetical protein